MPGINCKNWLYYKRAMEKQIIYCLKTEKTSKVPAYIQVRDKDFTLVSHIPVKGIKRGLEKLSQYRFPENFDLQLMNLPQGKLKKYQL